MNISGKTKLCIIIGDPIEHTLSPKMHNAAYKTLQIDDQFIYIAAHVKIESLEDCIKGVKSMSIRGLTCTIPHKTAVLKYLDWIDDTAQKIGAVNTVVNDDGLLKGYNTDWLGVVTPLEKLTSLSNRKVAILGAGGAARAAAFGAQQRGAKVTIFNRTPQKAEQLGKDLSCEIKGLESINEVQDYDIIVNTSSVGMKPLEDRSLVPKKYIKPFHIIFDCVYSPHETKLLKEAKEKGATIVYGSEMLLYQGVAQFELYTNQSAPVEVMRESLNI